MVQPGWLAVYGKDATGDEPTLTPVKVREIVEPGDAREGAAPTRGASKAREGRDREGRRRRR